MTPRTDRPRRRTPLLLAAGAVLVLLVAAAVVLLSGRGDDDEDGLGALRDQAAVEEARRVARSVEVRLRPGTDAAGVRSALDALPAPADRGRATVTLGRASVVASAVGPPDVELASLLVALANVRTPGGTVALRGDAPTRITAQVDDPQRAVPLAREIAARVAPRGRWSPSVARMQVKVGGAAGRIQRVAVSLVRPSSAASPVALAALDAAGGVPGWQPQVLSIGRSASIALRAAGVADARRAWRATVAALRLGRGEREQVAVSVAIAGGGATEGRIPSSSVEGSAGQDPDRALRTVRALAVPGVGVSAPVGASSASATATTLAAARRATAAARSIGLDDLTVRWPADRPPLDWMTRGPRDPGSSVVGDDPAGVARLLAGAARARAAGLPGVAWSTDAVDGVARLDVARPRWLPTAATPDSAPGRFRRLFRAIRTLGWPGTARLELAVGPGGCEPNPRTPGLVTITSTASGRGQVRAQSSRCIDAGLVRAARRAWEATAG